MNREEIGAELQVLYNLIAAPVDRHNPESLGDALMERGGWLARAGVLEIEAEYHLTRARGEAAEILSEQKLPQDREKRKIESMTAEEARLYGLAHRLHTTISQQIDSFRSMLSYAKESMKL